MSPSVSDSNDDLVEIKQEKDSGGNVDSARLSGEKLKHVAYEQGGGSSGTKKKNQSFSSMMAQSISDIAQSIVLRSSMLQHRREGGVQVESKTHKLLREKLRREALLNEVMLMRRDANLTAAESVKCMMLFNCPQGGHRWVDTFLAIPPSEWQAILKGMNEEGK